MNDNNLHTDLLKNARVFCHSIQLIYKYNLEEEAGSTNDKFFFFFFTTERMNGREKTTPNLLDTNTYLKSFVYQH